MLHIYMNICFGLLLATVAGPRAARADAVSDYKSHVVYVDGIPGGKQTLETASGVALRPSIVVVPASKFKDTENVTLRRGTSAQSYDAKHIEIEGADFIVVALKPDGRVAMAPVSLAKVDPVTAFDVTAITATLDGFDVTQGKARPGPKPALNFSGISPQGAALFDNCGDVVGLVSGNGHVVLAAELAASLRKSNIPVMPAPQICTAAGSGNPEANLRNELDHQTIRANTAEKHGTIISLQKQRNDAAAHKALRDAANARARQRQLIIYGGGAALAAVLLGIVLALWLWMRSRGLRRELDDAKGVIGKTNPAWNDCVLEGDAGTLKLSGLRLSNGGLIVGRSRQDADVLLDKEDISRRHARFELSDGAIEVTDLASTNRTHVNGAPLENGQSRRLYDGDRVLLASNEFQFKILQRRGRSNV